MRIGATLALAAAAVSVLAGGVSAGPASLPLLIFTAVHDDPDDQAAGLIAALKASRAPHLRTRLMDTDHGFNDHRIALEVDVLRWLERLNR